MPARLSSIQQKSLKRFKFSVLLLFFPFYFSGQTLTGLWTGALSNDSTTVRKDQLFEIALTEYKGKVYGYSRSEFIVNDTLYYIVKRVKGTIAGDVCEVTDDDIIAYNFRGKLDKGVKVTSTFRRNSSDSSWYLAGNWKTNATKKYYSVTGKVDLEQEKDLAASKLFPHLEELKLAKDIAFYKERNEVTPIVKIARPEKIKTEYTFSNEPIATGTELALSLKQPELQRVDPEIILPELKKPNGSLPKTETKEIAAAGPSITPKQPELQRVDPEIILPAIKKPEGSLPKTETKDLAAAPGTAKPVATDKTSVVKTPEIVTQKEKEPLTTSSATVKTTAPVNTNPSADKKPVLSDPVTKNDAVRPNTTAKAATKTPATNNTNQPSSVQAAPASATPDSGNRAIAKNTPAIDKRSTLKPGSGNPDDGTRVPNNTVSATKPNPIPVAQNVNASRVTTPSFTASRKSMEELTQPVAEILGRKSEFSQVVHFKSDSLQLSLYDNGEIDGDTVSVLMNGELIMAMQGLKASAIRKTIYIQPGQNEDFTLVLFAENLGKYPPNTGLLVVHDGEDIYHLRFSSDYQKSAGIIFRRK